MDIGPPDTLHTVLHVPKPAARWASARSRLTGRRRAARMMLVLVVPMNPVVAW